MIYLAMLIIPTFIALGFFIASDKKVTIGEFTLQMVAQAIIIGCLVAFQGCQNTGDVETHNGRVTKKASERVSCEHSYSCNCVNVCSGSGNNQSCTTICQTCYDHSYDIDWAVYTSLGERLRIRRVNSQGTREPERFTSTKIGEPTSTLHPYVNYVKAAPDSLFRHQGLIDQYKGKLPNYPQDVYDYYRLNRLVTVGTVPNITPSLWNKALSEVNADVGQPKQANLILVLVDDLPSDYFEALQQHWVGSKKNDIVAVVSLHDNNIQWARVMAWTTDKMAETVIADTITSFKTLNDSTLDPFMAQVKADIEFYYKRKPMKDFEYLASTVTPTVGQWVFSLIFGAMMSIGISLYMRKN